MGRRFIKLASAVLAALTLATASPTASYSQGLDIYIGEGRYRPYRDRGWNRCDPYRAISVARAWGLRRPRIIDVTQRRVIVAGIGFKGERASVTLANTPRCNRLDRRR